MELNSQNLLKEFRGKNLNEYEADELYKYIESVFDNEFHNVPYKDYSEERAQSICVLNQLLVAYFNIKDKYTCAGKGTSERREIFDDTIPDVSAGNRKDYFNQLINCVVLANRCAHQEESSDYAKSRKFFQIKDFLAKNYLIREKEDFAKEGIQLYKFYDSETVKNHEALIISQTGFELASIHLSQRFSDYNRQKYQSLDDVSQIIDGKVEKSPRKYIDRKGNPYVSNIGLKSKEDVAMDFLEVCVESQKPIEDYEIYNALSRLGAKREEYFKMRSFFDSGKLIFEKLDIKKFFEILGVVRIEPSEFKDFFSKRSEKEKSILIDFVSQFVIENSKNSDMIEVVNDCATILNSNVSDKAELKTKFEGYTLPLPQKLKIIYGIEIDKLPEEFNTKSKEDKIEIMKMVSEYDILKPQEQNRNVHDWLLRKFMSYKMVYLDSVGKLHRNKLLKEYSIDDVFSRLNIPTINIENLVEEENAFSRFWIVNLNTEGVTKDENDIKLKKRNSDQKESIIKFLGYSLGRAYIDFDNNNYNINDLKWFEAFKKCASPFEMDRFEVIYAMAYRYKVMSANGIAYDIMKHNDAEDKKKFDEILIKKELNKKDLSFLKVKIKDAEDVYNRGKFKKDLLDFWARVNNTLLKNQERISKIIVSKIAKTQNVNPTVNESCSENIELGINEEQLKEIANSPDGMVGLQNTEKILRRSAEKKKAVQAPETD